MPGPVSPFCIALPLDWLAQSFGVKAEFPEAGQVKSRLGLGVWRLRQHLQSAWPVWCLAVFAGFGISVMGITLLA